MSLTTQDEMELADLFKKQETLTQEDPEYFSNREIIVKKLLPKLKPSFTLCQYAWFKKYHVDMADSESLMYSNLLHAVDTYKISKGHCKFNSFFWTINGQLFKNYLDKVYARKRMLRIEDKEHGYVFSPTVSLSSLDQKTGDSADESPSNFREPVELADPEKFEENLHYKLLLEKIYKGATKQQRRVLRRLFFGKTYKQTGQALRISLSEVYKIVQKVKSANIQFADRV